MTSTPPVDPPREAKGPRRAIVIVNTGDGKGKSTAAFGTLMRSVARGWKVAVVQFVKSGDWKVGEEAIGRRLGVDWWTVGDGFTWDSEDLDESQAVARAGWDWARSQIMSGDYELVVLDEVTYPVNWGWIDEADVVETLRSRPGNVNVVLTGRDASAALVEVADTVTEMTNVKHAYDAGIPARRGIDY